MDINRAEGVLLGLACGDALGRPVEFKSSGEIEAEYGTLTEMVGHGTWNQPAGTITDDTDQALCIARSIAECGEFDPTDIADRFVNWYETDPFDIGRMTRRSLRKLQEGQSWDEAGRRVWEHSPEGSNAGNGSVMRCPPIAIAFVDDTSQLVEYSKQSSEITHADPRCTYGCAVLNLTIAGILQDKPNPLASAIEHIAPDASDELIKNLKPVAEGEAIDTLQTSGYVVHTLQTALHDGLRASDIEDAIVTAVNRGGDTDTIGAVTGAIAGARFGASSIPDSWKSSLTVTAELRELVNQLAD